MYLDELYGEDGEKWFFNPENYGRQLYRRPGDKKKKLPLFQQLQKDYNPDDLMRQLDDVENIVEEAEIIKKLNHIFEKSACQVLPLRDALNVAEIVAPMASLSCICRRASCPIMD